MVAPGRGAMRLLRASALGLTCMILGLAAHVLAGGAKPSIAATLALSIPLACACMALTSRRCGMPSIAGCMIASQIALHQAFMWLSAGQGCVSPATPAGMHLGHPGSPHVAISCSTAMAAMGHGGAAAMAGLSVPMVGAHVLAGLLATVVLAHGERALWRLAAWVGRPALLVGGRPCAAPGSVRVAFPPVVAFRQARVAAGPVSRRGPPLPI